MTEGDFRIVEAIHRLIRASEQTRVELTTTEAVLREAVAHIEGGGCITEGLQEFPVARRREAVQEALARMVKARHELRLHFISRALDDGLSVQENADLWGISRQRVGQYLRELHDRGRPVPT